MHPDPRIRLAVSAFRNPVIGVAAGCRLRSIRSSATRIEVAMRIVIDLNRCLGYAQCVPLAPEVLKLSGEETLTYDPNPDDRQRLRVLRAAASCPVQAIIVDRPDSD
jgi:ferredoxin